MKTKNPQHCLLMFDLDGTLIDSRKDIATAVNLMRRDFGLESLPMDTIAGYVGDGTRKLVERALSGFETDIKKATHICATYYTEHLHDETTLYPNVRESLLKLKAAGYKLAIITNKLKDACVDVLEHFDMLDFFDCVLGAGDTKKLKPDPEPLLLAMKIVRVKPENSWMIGDHRTDLEAARLAGCQSVFLTHGMGVSGNENASKTMNSFSEVTTFFLAKSKT